MNFQLFSKIFVEIKRVPIFINEYNKKFIIVIIINLIIV